MSTKTIKLLFMFFLSAIMAIPAVAAETVKIGALFSITGPPSFLGEPERNTAQMLVDEINKAGGLKGRKIELVVYDTSGDPTKANQAATRLIREDRVAAIIGPSTTGETMAIIPIVEKAGIPLISCAAGVKITDPVKRWVFKTAQNDALAVARIYEQLKKRRINKIAILTLSDGFGSSGREQLIAQVTKIRGSQAQALICWGTNPEPAVVARNVKQLGLKIPLYMSHGVSSKKFIELAGDAAEGIMLPSGRVLVASFLPNNDPQKQALIAYVKNYQQALQDGGRSLRRPRLGRRDASEGRCRTGR